MTAHIPNRSIAPRVHFIRAAFAQANAHATHSQSSQFLRGADAEVAEKIIQRAAVAPGMTSTAGWADELALSAFGDFLGDLAEYSGASSLIKNAVKANVTNHVEALYPVRAAGPTAATFVAEGAAIPVRSNTFSTVTIGPTRKLAHMLVWTKELSRRSDARAIFEQCLKEDVGAGIDAAFFATTAASAAAPAGLLNGLTPGVGFSGGDREAVTQDLTSLAVAVAAGGSGAVKFIMNPTRVARMRILDPVLAGSLDIAASSAVPTDRIICADAAGLLVSVDSAPVIDVGEHVALHLSDAPLPISDAGVADPVASSWQKDSTALRIIHETAFVRRRSTAVSYLDGATW